MSVCRRVGERIAKKGRKRWPGTFLLASLLLSRVFVALVDLLGVSVCVYVRMLGGGMRRQRTNCTSTTLTLIAESRRQRQTTTDGGYAVSVGYLLVCKEFAHGQLSSRPG